MRRFARALVLLVGTAAMLAVMAGGTFVVLAGLEALLDRSPLALAVLVVSGLVLFVIHAID